VSYWLISDADVGTYDVSAANVIDIQSDDSDIKTDIIMLAIAEQLTSLAQYLI